MTAFGLRDQRIKTLVFLGLPYTFFFRFQRIICASFFFLVDLFSPSRERFPGFPGFLWLGEIGKNPRKRFFPKEKREIGKTGFGRNPGKRVVGAKPQPPCHL